ncbi:MAG: hypothetical protein KJO07_09765, partial [Deltaproteobacteria bacterium]|nr:hypothetical protein [Deltaproteobacteria bacterium]
MRIKVLIAAAAALFAIACGSEDKGGAPDECNPLGGPACLMPWPSSAYLEDDPSAATGVRLALPAEAMPVNIDGVAIKPDYFNRFDGYSVSGPMLVDFETGVSADGLPHHTDPGASLRPDSPVVVINMDTGDRVILFAEPDLNGKEPENQTLIIRPLDRLQSASRYVVAVRKSVKAADGGEIPVPEAFQRLVDGKSLNHPLGERVEGEYPEIFQVLEDAGIPRDDLLMAWSFKTASDDYLFGDLLAMRSQAYEMMGPTAEGFEFDVEVLSNGNPEEVRHFLAGTYDVPMFLTDGESDTSILDRDGAGVPVANGKARAKWAAIVPRCVETQPLPRPAILFGHGIFGNALDSLDYSFLQQIAEDNCVVVIGGDWIGLTNRQFAAVAFAMNDINRGLSLTEKLHQGLINFIALGRVARHQFANAPELQFEGQAIIDPNNVQYFGASLGGILGNVFMAFDQDIERGALGVPGGPWTLLFERSTYWPPLRITMQ